MALSVEAEAALPRMRELRDGGLSYRQIAAQLDADGLPTARGGRWHYSVVLYALDPAAREAARERQDTDEYREARREREDTDEFREARRERRDTDECREASRLAAERRSRAAGIRPVSEVFPPPAHGTVNGYAAHVRAREKPCDPCRLAHNADQRVRAASHQRARIAELRERFGDRCNWCGDRLPSDDSGVYVDRIIPGIRGGQYEDDNVQPLHAACSSSKCDRCMCEAPWRDAPPCREHPSGGLPWAA